MKGQWWEYKMGPMKSTYRGEITLGKPICFRPFLGVITPSYPMLPFYTRHFLGTPITPCITIGSGFTLIGSMPTFLMWLILSPGSCWLTPQVQRWGWPNECVTRKAVVKLDPLGISKNCGTPKSSILIGFSIISHPFWGTPILETPLWWWIGLGRVFLPPPPKFNSSPLKSYRNPIGKACLPTTIFQGLC